MSLCSWMTTLEGWAQCREKTNNRSRRGEAVIYPETLGSNSVVVRTSRSIRHWAEMGPLSREEFRHTGMRRSSAFLEYHSGALYSCTTCPIGVQMRPSIHFEALDFPHYSWDRTRDDGRHRQPRGRVHHSKQPHRRRRGRRSSLRRP